ncbi:DNA-directed RNA polymerase subunit alpha [Candidatus Azambacteria bacterium]|nr:DNA-directed RNA polymerase subunit alpha [Candidatus Azambacteria bacterium]
MIPLPSKIKTISDDEQHGVFEIVNLYPGYGITIGNAIRRVILSSISGASITFIKIKGVNHEFSTIPGVLEDVIEIMMNIKQVRVKLIGNETQTLSFKSKGVGDFKAGDIVCPSQVEVMNKDQHIASLTDKKVDFDIELTVERGLGYEPVESRSKEKLEIGTIALDAIFTPIRKINFESEDMRVGNQTNFNRLTINIDTDGSILPSEALNQGIEILTSQFSQFLPEKINNSIFNEEKLDTNELSGKEINDNVSGELSDEDLASIEAQPVRYLELSTRLTNALIQSGIKTVGKLIKKKPEVLLEFKGVGNRGVEEINNKLAKYKLSLRKK